MHIAHESLGLQVSTTPGGGEVPSSRPRRIVGRRGHRLVFLDIDEVWAVEAQDRLTFVHAGWGRFDLDVSLAAIQLSFARDLVRVHRNWLVNLAWVKELESRGGESQLFRATLLAGTAGLRRKAGPHFAMLHPGTIA